MSIQIRSFYRQVIRITKDWERPILSRKVQYNVKEAFRISSPTRSFYSQDSK